MKISDLMPRWDLKNHQRKTYKDKTCLQQATDLDGDPAKEGFLIPEVEGISALGEMICYTKNTGLLNKFSVTISGGIGSVGNSLVSKLSGFFGSPESSDPNGHTVWNVGNHLVRFRSSDRDTYISVEQKNISNEIPEGGICQPQEVAGNFQCGAFGMPWMSKKSDVLKALGVGANYDNPWNTSDGRGVHVEGAYKVAPNLTVVNPGLSFDDNMRFVGISFSGYDDRQYWGEHAISSAQLDQILEMNNLVINRNFITSQTNDIDVHNDRSNHYLGINYSPLY